ncbi:hypothetical protein [Marinitoga sp. 38H-ov]|nr:hypothetical protein [Marinitoga sp. 38H-ov]
MKKAIIVIIIIFSLFAFGFNIDIGNNISISKNIWKLAKVQIFD